MRRSSPEVFEKIWISVFFEKVLLKLARRWKEHTQKYEKTVLTLGSTSIENPERETGFTK